MLVLYTIREHSFCTQQKQICDSYIIPRQTINNVIGNMQKSGFLEISRKNCIGREEGFILTKDDAEKLQPVMESQEGFEEKAVLLLGEERLERLTALMLDYDQALNASVVIQHGE